jgi:hypothetical protein
MDMTMQLSRTVKGQEEIFNLGHTLRPSHRQILFSIGNGISFRELRSKLPNCVDLETMVNDLLQSGFIQSLRNMATGHVAATAVPSSPTVPATPAICGQPGAGRATYWKSWPRWREPNPLAYRQMSEVRDLRASTPFYRCAAR